MEALRTPDERFQNLRDYPFAPNYVEVDDQEGGRLRIHYVDEGPRDGEVVLMLHGEPSWSYLYRKMVAPMVAAGYRVIAPDLIGFGRSDKPARRRDYTHARHVRWVRSFIEQLSLTDVTLVCQDWGGLIGLRLLTEIGDRFARVVAANTILPHFPMRHPALEGAFGLREGLNTLRGFGAWLLFSQLKLGWKAGEVLQMGTVTRLSREVRAAYDAPFPSRKYMAGALAFPVLVMSDPRGNRAAWPRLMEWRKPFLCAFSDKDRVLGALAGVLPALVPGCQGQPHTTIRGGGHFLQEDQGEQLAAVVIDFIRSNPVAH